MKTDEQYDKLVKISEKKNPFAQECPNRHLWSEGYRAAMLEKSDIESLIDKVKGLKHSTNSRIQLEISIITAHNNALNSVIDILKSTPCILYETYTDDKGIIHDVICAECHQKIIINDKP